MLWIFAIENFFPLQIRYFNNVKEALLLNEREGSRLVFWFSFCIYTCFATDSKSGQNRALQMGKCGLCSSFSVVYFPVVGSSDFTFFPRKLHEFLSWAANVVGIGVTDMWSWEGFRKDPCLHFITWNIAILLYSFSSNLKKKKKVVIAGHLSVGNVRLGFLQGRRGSARPPAALCPWWGGPGRRHFRRPLGSHFSSCPRAGLLAAKSCSRSVPRHSWQWG